VVSFVKTVWICLAGFHSAYLLWVAVISNNAAIPLRKSIEMDTIFNERGGSEYVETGHS
jgi:hypothetical protein